MSSESIKKIAILGGGTAGWMTACYLDRQFNQAGQRAVDITLIESDDVDIIGVGESTFDSIRGYLQAVGVDESEFMLNTDASLKHGIYFKDWYRGDDEYFHPFEKVQIGDGVNMLHHWVNLHQREINQHSISEGVGIQYKAAMAAYSPKISSNKDYEAPLPYSYHLDAVLMGRYLRKVSTARGVKHIVAHAEHIELADDGRIQSIISREGERYDADFFVDCTGFAQVLMRALKNTDYVDYRSSLLCDRAVAAQVALPQEEGSGQYNPRPYTSAVAQESGWIWDIDLYRRRGCGYVYSSEFSDEARAEEVLFQYLGQQYSGKQCPNIEPRFLKMRIGRAEKFWHKNCVSIGLSGGFIEPLESTGIVFIDSGVRFLAELLGADPCSKVLSDRYNNMMGSLYDETRNFIELHYVLSQRADSAFWRHYRDEVKPSSQLQERLALWREKIPSSIDFSDTLSTFWENSHNFIMYGMNWKHSRMPANLQQLDSGRSIHMLSEMQKIQTKALLHFETHLASLDRIRARGKRVL